MVVGRSNQGDGQAKPKLINSQYSGKRTSNAIYFVELSDTPSVGLSRSKNGGSHQLWKAYSCLTFWCPTPYVPQQSQKPFTEVRSQMNTINESRNFDGTGSVFHFECMFELFIASNVAENIALFSSDDHLPKKERLKGED